MKPAHIASALKTLKKIYPDAECSLAFHNQWELLVATILSAQCTDKRVNIVTKALFKEYPSVNSFAEARIESLEQSIYSTGFYKNKARAIKKSAQMIIEKYQSKVPKTMKELLALYGVARKTANVVLGNGFGVSEGIVVDTHVARIAKRLEWTKEKNPVKIEQDLMKIISKKDWILFPHLLIAHGRALCVAKKPKCANCPLRNFCPSAFLEGV